MALSKSQIRHLRALAQALKPVVWIGQHGLSAAVLAEVEQTLEHHELIKVKLRGLDREDRGRTVEELCRHSGAECVQQMGQTAVLYRRAREHTRLRLPA